MRIVAMSDIHGKHKKLNVPEGDILIVGGDVVSSDFEHAVEFLSWMATFDHRHKIFVPGNCDGIFEIDPESMQDECDKRGISLLIDSGVVINNELFWGSPITPTHGNMAFNRDEGDPIREHWAMIPPETRVLITHGPPYGILDKIAPDIKFAHLGCPELLDRVETIRPKLHIFGHIHGGFGTLARHGTRFYNVAVCTEQFKPTNGVTVIEYEIEK